MYLFPLRGRETFNGEVCQQYICFHCEQGSDDSNFFLFKVDPLSRKGLCAEKETGSQAGCCHHEGMEFLFLVCAVGIMAFKDYFTHFQ